MQVVPVNTSKETKEILSSVSQKGQVTIPQEIRRQLGVKPKDKIAFRMEKGEVKIIPVGFPLENSFQAIPALKKKVGIKEMTRIAAEEAALRVANE